MLLLACHGRNSIAGTHHATTPCQGDSICIWSIGSKALSSSEMTSSLSFDRAASVYDQTRPLPEPGATLGIQAILDIAGPQARILDVGAGTGRVSIPLLQRGANLVGIDLAA